jgi:hypothetical protein
MVASFRGSGLVDLLDADIHAAIRFGQIFRVTPGGDNPASFFADGQGDGPSDPAASADDQYGPIFQGRHLFSFLTAPIQTLPDHRGVSTGRLASLPNGESSASPGSIRTLCFMRRPRVMQ